MKRYHPPGSLALALLLVSGLPVAAHPGHSLASMDVRHAVTSVDHLAWLVGISLAMFALGVWLVRTREGRRRKEFGPGNAA